MYMQLNKRILIIITILSILITGCGDDDGNPVDNVDNQNGEISFTVDGETKSFNANALHIITDDDTPNSTSIGLNNSGETTLQIIFRGSPGDLVNYEASNLDDDDSQVILSVIYSDGDASYFNTETSTGELNITEYTDNSLSGEFNFSLKNPINDAVISLDNGSIDDIPVTDNVQ